MNFQHLAYWQEKAKNLAIETRLFINGEYCAAADNTTFETIDPAAQQTLAQVARGKKADVERAVKAARQAFDNGDWSQASPAQRKAILTRFADLMEAHREELALLETLDTGKPFATACATIFPAPPAPFAGMPKRWIKSMAKWPPPAATSWR
ncbi:Aldehyde dehydrogenase PuuC [Klebsiella pneumoniae]|nr:Aldehyde dehydrogenase PuuC [Klebsiella pneumoniae]